MGSVDALQPRLAGKYQQLNKLSILLIAHWGGGTGGILARGYQKRIAGRSRFVLGNLGACLWP